MAESLKEHDPYNDMETGEKDIRPEFLADSDEKKAAAGALLNAEKDADGEGDKPKNGGLSDLKMAEVAGGLYKGGGGKAALVKEGVKMAKSGKGKKIGLIVVALLFLPILVILVIATPQYLIYLVDMNLMDATGYMETVATLEEQSEYVTQEMMAKGEFPSGYASDLAENGLLVGQVTASGQFVRTNNYIADIEELKDLAAIGEHFVKTGEGELAILYNDKVITADNFVLAVESDPRMLADYLDAVDISTRYFYSNDVSDVYKKMGITRDAFKDWESSGDNEKDEEEFNKILNKMLDDKSDLALSGYDLVNEIIRYCAPEINIPDVPSGESSEGGSSEGGSSEGGSSEGGGSAGGGEASGGGDSSGGGSASVTTMRLAVETEIPGAVPCEWYNATYLVDDVSDLKAADIITRLAGRTEDDTVSHATDKAAQLLNQAVSASEPYLAASVFMAIEEPIQRARAGDNGPVNQVMNALTKQTEIEYVDVNTGNTVKTKKSIMETRNFVAAVSTGVYDRDEANNFSRDRIVNVTNRVSDYATRETIVSSGERKNQGILSIMRGNEDAESSKLMSAESSLDIGVLQKNSDLFSTVVGGNRALSGGSFALSEINRQVIAAMPSDKNTIIAYHQEVEKVLARKAEAERAKKSPFDISSPYTFMGSLMRKVGSAVISNMTFTKMTTMPIVNTVANLTSNAMAGLFGVARAEGDEDKFTTISGDCPTVNSAADVEGDLYCTSHGTLTTEYMHYTEEDWKEAKVIDNNGIKSNGMKDFIKYGMDRGATVGVQSADVCVAYYEEHGNIFQRIWKGILSLFGLGELFNACDYTPDDVSTGAKYTLSDSNRSVGSMKKYSGFALYDTVSSLLKEKQSKISAYKEQYYAEHPVDNSAAGRIARISGMTKSEAQVALNYAAELITIAMYNASERYAFGETLKLSNDGAMMFEDAEIMMATYALILDKMSFADVRNRTNLV